MNTDTVAAGTAWLSDAPIEQPEQAETPRDGGVTYHGSFADLFVLLFKTGLLTLLTLGIYRFWAKTRVRRYLWDSVEVAGSRFEYTGTGKELFIGFLIALCVLVPLLFGINLVAGLSGDLLTQMIVGYLGWVPILWLIFFATFRLWRYRLSRTNWRGVFFRIEGRGRSYANYAFGQYLIGLVTAGLYVPWADTKCWRYRIDRTSFGDHGFHFEGDARQKLLLAWLVPWMALVLSGAFSAAAFSASGASFEALLEGETLSISGEAAAYKSIAGTFFFIAFVGYYLYNYIKLRFFLSGLRLRNMVVTSHLSVKTIFVLCGWLVFAIVCLFIFLPVSVAIIIALGGMGVFSQFLTIFVLLAIFMLLFLPLFKGILLNVLLGAICRTMTIENTGVLTEVAQAAERGPAKGEGLADALDVGAF